MFKITKFYCILRMNCAKSCIGDFFVRQPYKVSTMSEVKERCAKGDRRLKLETGFYEGSYYVSYALGVALYVCAIVLNFILRETISVTERMTSFILALLILLSILHTLSKIIWAAIFIKFDENAIANFQLSLENDSGIKE